jgi:glucuronate isomerase
MIADDINKGLMPNDLAFFGKIVQDICYNNLKNFLKIKY